MRCPEWSHFQLSSPFSECGADALEFQISVLDKGYSGYVVCSHSSWKLTNRRPVETVCVASPKPTQWLFKLPHHFTFLPGTLERSS